MEYISNDANDWMRSIPPCVKGQPSKFNLRVNMTNEIDVESKETETIEERDDADKTPPAFTANENEQPPASDTVEEEDTSTVSVPGYNFVTVVGI